MTAFLRALWAACSGRVGPWCLEVCSAQRDLYAAVISAGNRLLVFDLLLCFVTISVPLLSFPTLSVYLNPCFSKEGCTGTWREARSWGPRGSQQEDLKTGPVPHGGDATLLTLDLADPVKHAPGSSPVTSTLYWRSGPCGLPMPLAFVLNYFCVKFVRECSQRKGAWFRVV